VIQAEFRTQECPIPVFPEELHVCRFLGATRSISQNGSSLGKTENCFRNVGCLRNEIIDSGILIDFRDLGNCLGESRRVSTRAEPKADDGYGDLRQSLRRPICISSFPLDPPMVSSHEEDTKVSFHTKIYSFAGTTRWNFSGDRRSGLTQTHEILGPGTVQTPEPEGLSPSEPVRTVQVYL
jgi:hypothetical protein